MELHNSYPTTVVVDNLSDTEFVHKDDGIEDLVTAAREHRVGIVALSHQPLPGLEPSSSA